MSRLGDVLEAMAPRATATWRLYRRLGSGAQRAAFVRRAIARRVFGYQESLPAPRPDGQVLFVCHGNIMRSALAEVALRHDLALDTFRIASAGTAAVPGTPADPRARAYAEACGLDLRGHRARALEDGLLEQSDVIFALDRRIEAELLARSPALRPRVFLLAGISSRGGYRGEDVIDPYSLPEGPAAESFALVLRSVRTLAERLRAPRGVS